MMDKVAEWVQKHGFSLEMRAAAAFRKAGFEVKQSAHYHDRGLGLDREIDVIARRATLQPTRVHFVAECKSSDKPWVALISPDTLNGTSRTHAWGILTQEAIDTFSAQGDSFFRLLPWYEVPDECGYSLRKAFVDRDDGFAAATAVCRAAQYQVLPMQADRRQLPEYAVSFPVIVVDSPIIECRLSDTGSIELIEVNRSEILFEDHAMFDAWVRIRVIHIDYLEAFASDAHNAAGKIHSLLSGLPRPGAYEEQQAVKFYPPQGRNA